MQSDPTSFIRKIVTSAERPRWRAVMMVVYGGMAAVMLRGWFGNPGDSFYLIMSGFFAGWAIENAIRQAFPDGNHVVASQVAAQFTLVACAFLFGRDGHWGYAAVMLCGLVGYVGAAVLAARAPATATVDKPGDRPA